MQEMWIIPSPSFSKKFTLPSESAQKMARQAGLHMDVDKFLPNSLHSPWKVNYLGGVDCPRKDFRCAYLALLYRIHIHLS